MSEAGGLWRARVRVGAVVVGAVLVSQLQACGKGADSQKAAQSAALFAQLAPVLQHPRCMNCHPKGDFPHQGDDRHQHTMNVVRGPEDHGAPGLHCDLCHQATNQAASGVPGAADWKLAPLRMAWEGLSVGELCRALLDPARGGMKPEQFIPHFKTSLVVWAFDPGINPQGQPREKPPLTYEQFMDITQRWVESGAACPET